MKSLNRVMLIGNLGGDPETRFFADGDAITTASLCTNEKIKTDSGWQDRPEWHSLVFRNRGNYPLAEHAGNFLKKGSRCHVEGRLRTRKVEQEGGPTRYFTEIIVSDLILLDRRQDGGPGSPQTPGGRAGPDPAQGQTSEFGDFHNDDIPF